MTRLFDLTCTICGSQFNNLRSTTKFCGKKCANRDWYLNNRDSRLKKNKEFRTINPDYMKEHYKIWKERNSDYHSMYSKKNAEKIAKRKRNRYCKDINFKIKDRLRNRLYQAIRFNKSGSAVRDLGCSIEELRKHLESQFQPGMSWDNYGRDGWHIDHVVPLDFFTLDKLEEIKAACHYSNLQPLWAEDNLKKSTSVSCEIILVAGVSGAGKTTLSNRLGKTHNIIEADNVKPHELIKHMTTNNNIIYTMSVGVSSFIRRCNNVCPVKLIVITECEKIIKDRLHNRGGKMTDSIKKRIRRMNNLAINSYYSGTYSEVEKFLKKDDL